jgi:hypothetical protein
VANVPFRLDEDRIEFRLAGVFPACCGGPVGRCDQPKEIKRRTDVVGVFPNPAAVLLLADAALVEQHDDWEAGDRRYLPEAFMTLLSALNAPARERVEEVVSLRELSTAQSNQLTRTVLSSSTTQRDLTPCCWHGLTSQGPRNLVSTSSDVFVLT